jgi:dCMP deaminase
VKQKFIDAYMDVAERFAQLSSAKRLKVGAIIVKENRIISIGYNGMPSGWSNECEHIRLKEGVVGVTLSDIHPADYDIYCELITKQEVMHAETNAIAKVAQSSESCKGAALFCTHTPCIECAKLIYQSGISTIYYRNEYNAHKGSGLSFLNQCGLTVIHVTE